MENNLKKAYLSSENLITLLSSSYGDKINKEFPGLISEAKKTMLEYENAYMDSAIIDNIEAQNLLENVIELKDTLSIISQDSYETIKKIEEEIKVNSEKIQSDLLFNPVSFYNKYLLSLTAPLNETVSENVLKNERFKAWFGNSKVVDSDGNPSVLYHGTSGLKKEFDNFMFKIFPGAYFAVNKSYSEWFAKQKDGYYLYQVFLRVENPIDLTGYGVDKVTYEDFITYLQIKYKINLPENNILKALSDNEGGIWAWRYLRFAPNWLKMIRDTGYYDGIVYYENNPSDVINNKENVTKAWLVFNGNQIKSADIRNNTYSLFTDNIKLKQGGTLC
jgi:hypothetical protein